MSKVAVTDRSKRESVAPPSPAGSRASSLYVVSYFRRTLWSQVDSRCDVVPQTLRGSAAIALITKSWEICSILPLALALNRPLHSGLGPLVEKMIVRRQWL